MVWVPALSARVKVAPLPMGPSRLDVHWSAKDRSPSGMSVAVALKVTGWPRGAVATFAGRVIVTRGTELPAITWTAPAPASPAASVALAVTTCTPGESLAVTDDPLPRSPSRSERQTSAAPRSPSWGSVAVAANAVGAPATIAAPSPGAVISTRGCVRAGGGGKTRSTGPPLPASRATDSTPFDDGVRRPKLD